MREGEWVFVSVYSILFLSIKLCVFSRVCVLVCVLSLCVFKYAIICESTKIESLSDSLTKNRALREEDRSDELWDAIVSVV